VAQHVTVPGGDAPNLPLEGPGAPGADGDATLVSGQNPRTIFGIDISYESGAAGSAGAAAQPEGDPTLQPGQYPATEPISGVALDSTGAPGSQGANPGYAPVQPGTGFQVTDPNYTAGRPGGGTGIVQIPVSAGLSGPGDSTLLPGQYGDPGNGMPSMAQPLESGAGQGRVLHGGFMNGRRPGETA
jgi:hypothetical protein